MPDPLVSIIIPVYNSGQYLDETIRSAMQQSWSNKEIILVDDGSTDNSLAIASEYRGERVKIYSQANQGASAARNKGLREAKGDYIQFLDGDDLLSANKIADQMALINGHSDHLAISRTIYFFDKEPLPPGHVKHDESIEYYNDPAGFLINMYYKTAFDKEQRGIVTVHSWLSPKTLLDKAGWWNEDLSVDDDGEYFCRVILESKQIIYVPDAINYYRKYRSNTNLSAGENIGAMRSRLLASELKWKHLKAKSANPLIDAAMAKVFMENAVTFYPQFMELYRVADKHVKELGGIAYVPVVGGKGIEFIKKIFGWRAAKLLSFAAGKLRRNFKK